MCVGYGSMCVLMCVLGGCVFGMYISVCISMYVRVCMSWGHMCCMWCVLEYVRVYVPGCVHIYVKACVLWYGCQWW